MENQTQETTSTEPVENLNATVEAPQEQQTEKTEQKEKPKPDIDLKKWLYSFVIKDGENSHKFYILKPTRTLKQRGEIEYAKQLSMFVKSGLLPKAAWSTILDNLGGTISESDAKEYEENRKAFIEKSIELEKLTKSDTEENIDGEKQIKIATLKADISIAQLTMQRFELEQVYIFENTADAKARNATIQWWLSELAYKNENESFFKGNTFEEKMDWYDGLSPENNTDAIMLRAGKKFSYLITIWFLGRVNSWEDFYSADQEDDK